ncbi:MAG: glutathione S-transferase C-terminal domain-containing protein [Oleiphilaceae bacterium]|nr:glutathione S-transferase C-terminal domain-containing protein [Oleiphilaceae bacterium]
MSEAIIWGVRLSPYTLKLEAALQYKGIAYRRLPAMGTHFENARIILRLEAAKRRKEVSRYPDMDKELDEYPLLPYFSHDKRFFEYDSSSILRRMEQEGEGRNIIPSPPLFNFLTHFIDEAFNEFGLYLVHHMRWVGSTKSNRMGKLLASEFKNALPPGGAWLLSRSFPARQVKRLPYLMSVAPKGYKAGVRASLIPPTKEDFPPTHELLEQSWKAILEALDAIFRRQNYIFGDHFSLTDASIYGQLGMNLVDPEAADKIKQIAPNLFAWLKRIDEGQFMETSNYVNENLIFNEKLSTLMNILMGTYAALMVQNERAHNDAVANGKHRFNEQGFDLGENIYTGKLRGYAFKSVVKSFQVRSWREVKEHWKGLAPSDREILTEQIQLTELLDY